MPCNKEFHPSCHKLHKVYCAENEFINCIGKYEILTIKNNKSDESSSVMKRTLSQTEESQQGRLSMEKKIDWLVPKIKDKMVSKKEIKNMITDIVKYETDNLKKKMEEMKRMIGNLNKEMKDEIQKMVNTSLEKREVKKSYSGIVKGNQTESMLIIKSKDGEEIKSSEDTKRDVRKIDVTKLRIGITKMKKVTGGAVVVEYENRVQAEKLKKEVVKDLGKKYEIQVPKKRKPKVKLNIKQLNMKPCQHYTMLTRKIVKMKKCSGKRLKNKTECRGTPSKGGQYGK